MDVQYSEGKAVCQIIATDDFHFQRPLEGPLKPEVIMQKQIDYNDTGQWIMSIQPVLQFLPSSNSKTKTAWPMVYTSPHFVK